MKLMEMVCPGLLKKCRLTSGMKQVKEPSTTDLHTNTTTSIESSIGGS